MIWDLKHFPSVKVTIIFHSKLQENILLELQADAYKTAAIYEPHQLRTAKTVLKRKLYKNYLHKPG